MSQSTRPEPFAQTPPPLRPAPEYPAEGVDVVHHRPPRRSFDVLVGTDRVVRHEGYGLTLDQVLDAELARWAGHDPRRGTDPFDEDLVVLEGRQVRAVIHAKPDSNPSVFWIDDDGPTARPSRPEDSYPTDEDLARERAEASAPAEGTPGPAGDDEEGDGPPAPPDPRAPRALRMPPRPLLRTTLTVAPPWDPDPVTIELIVLADDVPEGCETATRSDLPELREGGWDGRGVFGLQVYMRVKA